MAALRARNVSPYKASGSEPPDEGAGAAAAENPELRRAERERRKVSRVRMFHVKHPCAPITPRATARGRANAQAETPEESRGPELARTRTKPEPSRAQSVLREAPPAGRARRTQAPAHSLRPPSARGLRARPLFSAHTRRLAPPLSARAHCLVSSLFVRARDFASPHSPLRRTSPLAPLAPPRKHALGRRPLPTFLPSYLSASPPPAPLRPSQAPPTAAASSASRSRRLTTVAPTPSRVHAAAPFHQCHRAHHTPPTSDRQPHPAPPRTPGRRPRLASLSHPFPSTPLRLPLTWTRKISEQKAQPYR